MHEHAHFDPLPPGLLLTPLSRWPLQLPEETVAAVLARQIPASAAPVARTRPRFSIVVVSYNNLVFTRLSLESVLATVVPADTEIIVIDNGSEADTAAYLQELAARQSAIRIRYNRDNRGFAAATNQGLALARGELLVLLNNDTVVAPGWLAGLDRLLADPGVGLVGPVTNRCGNEAQIQASYDTYGEFLEFARTRQREHAGEVLEIPMPAMFCVALRRDTYGRLGPLDESFGIGLFEDEDYAERARAAGYRLLCAEDVFVHHFGQASIGKLAASGEYGELFHANRRRFEKKWGRAWRPQRRRPHQGYQRLIGKIRELVNQVVPRAATVMVLSRGDEDLLLLNGRRAWHFPQGEHGEYSGHHPADGDAAIKHLETLRAAGGQYLLLPNTAFWWLEFYPEFARHLAANDACLWQDDACLIYRLEEPGPPDPASGDPLPKIHGRALEEPQLVTVLLPAGEGREALKRTIGSLLRNTPHPHRVLILDDATTDPRSRSLIRSTLRRHRHVCALRNERELGYTATINRGCQLAPGDVVVLASAVELNPGWLEKLSACALRTGNTAAVSPAMPGQSPGSASPCLYLSRRALHRIGFLDQERCPGPESLADYCRRASEGGFAVLIDDAGSIGKGFDPHPFPPDRPCVLVVVHAGSGGALQASGDLAAASEDDYRCLLLKTAVLDWTLYESEQGGFRASRKYAFSRPWQVHQALDEPRLEVLADICDTFDVRLAHVHHLLGNGPDLVAALAARDLPVVFSFHDFYTLCPTAHLIDNRGRYCAGTCTPGAGECRLDQQFFRTPLPPLKHHYVHRHRVRMGAALAACRTLISPSRCTAALLTRFFPELADQDLRIIENGSDLGRSDLSVAPVSGTAARVLCLGHLEQAKGATLIGELLALNAAAGAPFEFHFLGRPVRGTTFEEAGGICHGPYRRADLADIVAGVGPSFSLLASICAETFSYTLSESWAMGLPVFASRVGALAERIEGHGGGWLFDPSDAQAFFRGMLAVLKSPEEYRRVHGLVGAIPLPRIAGAAARVKQTYGDALRRTTAGVRG